MEKGKPLKIVRGTTNAFGLEVTNAEGNSYTLKAGEELVFGLKYDPYTNAPVLEKVVTRSVDGEYYLELAPQDTVDLEPGNYIYDIGLRSGSAFYNVVECSPFLIVPNVTTPGDNA